MLKRTPCYAWLLAVALLTHPAAAQFLYKSTLPDGRIVYGDKPAPDAVKVESSKPDTSKTGITASTPKDAALARQMEEERLKRDGGGPDKVRAAEQALREAEAAYAAGKEPRSNERIGTAGGASRLTESYWNRQKDLEYAVEKARRNLDQARAGK